MVVVNGDAPLTSPIATKFLQSNEQWPSLAPSGYDDDDEEERHFRWRVNCQGLIPGEAVALHQRDPIPSHASHTQPHAMAWPSKDRHLLTTDVSF